MRGDEDELGEAVVLPGGEQVVEHAVQVLGVQAGGAGVGALRREVHAVGDDRGAQDAELLGEVEAEAATDEDVAAEGQVGAMLFEGADRVGVDDVLDAAAALRALDIAPGMLAKVAAAVSDAGVKVQTAGGGRVRYVGCCAAFLSYLAGALALLAAEPRLGILECARRLHAARGTVQARLDRLR